MINEDPVFQRIDSANLLYFCFFIPNLILCLYPQWLGADIWNVYNEPTEFIEKYNLYIFIIEFFISVFFFIKYGREIVGYKQNQMLLLFALFNMLSLVMNGMNGGAFSIFAVYFIYIYITNTDFYLHPLLSYLFLLLLLLWLFLPIIDFVTSDYQRQLLFLGGSLSDKDNFFGFSGYALHKNIYGLFAGLSIIIVYYQNFTQIIKYVLYVFLFSCIIISSCRSALIGVFFFVLYILYQKHSGRIPPIVKKYLIALCLLGALLMLASFSFFEDDDRKYIFAQFFEIIKSNPIFGTGSSNTVYSLGDSTPAPAHNFIIQGCADRGIIATYFYLHFMLLFYKNSDIIFKPFLLYLFAFGLFQPYVSIGIPNYLMTVVFLTPHLCNFRNEYHEAEC